MSRQSKKRCIVYTEKGEIPGTITNEYEEIGGADDGAIFAVIDLDNGQTITVKTSDIIEE
jgi:hypothetical protein